MVRRLSLTSLVLVLAAGVRAQDALPAGLVESELPYSTVEGHQVEGRLTRRADLPAGKHAALLLIHGSNQGARLRKDVDGTIPGTETADGRAARRFRDLAWALAREGFVVYRTAKRGYALDPARDRPEVVASITLERSLADGRRALARLREQERVDARRVVLFGHSEGTVVAPLLAKDDPDVIGLVLTGTVVDMDRVARFQSVERPVEAAFAALDLDRDGKVGAAELERGRARGVNLPYWLGASADKDKDGAVTRVEAQAQLLPGYRGFVNQARDPSDYWHGHMTATPNLELLPRLGRLPMIVVTGELDWRTPSDSVRDLQRAMQRAGHPDHLFVYCPGLGHGFSPPTEPRAGELGPRETAGPPDPTVVAGIARLAAERWLRPKPTVDAR